MGLFVALLSVLLCAAVFGPLPQTASAQTYNFNGKCDEASGAINSGNCAPVAYVLLATNILSAVVGLVVVIGIAYGGVQYTMAKDNPQQITAARERIRNAVLAFLVYLFMFSFLQWAVPGGIF